MERLSTGGTAASVVVLELLLASLLFEGKIIDLRLA